MSARRLSFIRASSCISISESGLSILSVPDTFIVESTSELLILQPAAAPTQLHCTVDEHARSPATKIDEDLIPAPLHRVPTTRRHIAPPPPRFSSVLAYFIILYNIHTFIGPSPNILRRCLLSSLTGSPMRETFVMLLYLDAHHTFPHRLRCVLLILFHIYFAFMFQTIPFILCHMLTYILHTNYDTQSSYKTVVELLCKKQQI